MITFFKMATRCWRNAGVWLDRFSGRKKRIKSRSHDRTTSVVLLCSQSSPRASKRI